MSAAALPPNYFKRALQSARQQIGLWCTLSNPYGIELLAGTGFDWLLIDTEHSPSDLVDVLAQLQAVAAYPVSAVVRPAWNDQVLIKRYLDVGAQTLLLPCIQNEVEARAAVRSVEYPTRGRPGEGGVRGVSALTRASRFGRVKNYATSCRDEICLLVQVETLEAIENIEAIARVDGVDGIFIGPGDLAASMGYLGEPSHPEVKAMVTDAIRRVCASGKPAGVLTGDRQFARQCIASGSTFTAVGVDMALLAAESTKLREEFQ